jgi:histidinol-phosphate aminotransferase
LTAGDGLHYPAGQAEERLRGSHRHPRRCPARWLVLANGIDEVLGMTLLWRRQRGPVLLFPPHDPADAARCVRYGVPTVGFQRAPSFALELDPDAAADLPPEAMALVTSPNDPTGNLLGAQEAVRLSRACDLVVVDERHGASSGRSLVPLVREFENLIVVQTFETWAGLAGFPVAYAVAPPKLARELAVYRRNEGVAMGAVVAAEATLDDLQRVRATAHWVRQERSRLFRTLRKLNLVAPSPPGLGSCSPASSAATATPSSPPSPAAASPSTPRPSPSSPPSSASPPPPRAHRCPQAGVD